MFVCVCVYSQLQDVEITEASGLIGDLLLNEHLSEGVEQKLKKVCELLAPRVAGHTAYTPRMNVANPIAEDRHDHESDVVTETNPQGPRVHVGFVFFFSFGRGGGGICVVCGNVTTSCRFCVGGRYVLCGSECEIDAGMNMLQVCVSLLLK